MFCKILHIFLCQNLRNNDLGRATTNRRCRIIQSSVNKRLASTFFHGVRLKLAYLDENDLLYLR